MLDELDDRRLDLDVVLAELTDSRTTDDVRSCFGHPLGFLLKHQEGVVLRDHAGGLTVARRTAAGWNTTALRRGDLVPAAELRRRARRLDLPAASADRLVEQMEAIPERARHGFRPRARLLVLLGDQLIRDEVLAVFELVKNAYDADASHADLRLEHLTDPKQATISVSDDGTGMSLRTITGTWLEPGTDNRAQQRARGERSPRYGRLPLGEKGVGRFAVHKLGRRIELVTRAADQPEVVVSIDWDEILDERYLDDVGVQVYERPAEVFHGDRTGTRVRIAGLRQDWKKGTVRELVRRVNSIRSPFAGPSDFVTTTVIDPAEDWLDDLINVEDVLSEAMWRASLTLDEGTLRYSYDFKPLPGMDGRINGRHTDFEGQILLGREQQELIDEFPDAVWSAIGRVDIELRMFDLDPSVLTYATSDRRGYRRFLTENGGVRVYRDGIRVFDYGSPGDDWLGIDQRRVNRPTERVSNNILIGSVNLRLEDSSGLVEKTNREGFVENGPYRLLQSSVAFAVQQIEAERAHDKSRLRDLIGGVNRRLRQPVIDELRILRGELQQRGLEAELGQHLDRVEKQFAEVQERLVTAAGSGLSLAIVIHELEKQIDSLRGAVRRDADIEQLRSIAEGLADLIDGLGYLTRRSGMSKERIARLVEYSLGNVRYRLEHHDISVHNTLGGDTRDFQMRCHRRLIIATLMNLCDNSIWWLQRRDGDRKTLWIGSHETADGHPALAVVDDGPGFSDPPEALVEPFLSRRPDGMGLGLHLAAEVMKTHRGRLTFPEPDEVGAPPSMTGAAVSLVFPEATWIA